MIFLDEVLKCRSKQMNSDIISDYALYKELIGNFGSLIDACFLNVDSYVGLLHSLKESLNFHSSP